MKNAWAGARAVYFFLKTTHMSPIPQKSGLPEAQKQLELKIKEFHKAGLVLLQDQVEKGAHLLMIPQMEALEWPWMDDEKKALETVQMDQIAKIVYDKNEDNLVKLNSLFSAVHAAGSAVYIFLRSDGRKTELFVGINGGSRETTSQALHTMEGGLEGNFPGIHFNNYSKSDIRRLSREIDSEISCISCVTGIPSRKNDEDIPFAQGLEKFIDAMGNRPYSALLLATPVTSEQLREAELAYHDLYSQLSLYNRNQMTLTGQQSVALGETIGTSFTDSFSKNLSKTNTTTHTDTQSQTLSNAKTFTVNHSVTLSESHTHTESDTESTTHSSSTSGGISFIASVNHSSSTSKTHSHSTSDADTKGKAVTDGTSSGETNGKANTVGISDATSEAISQGNTIGVTSGTNEQSSETRTALQGISYNFAVVAKRIVEAQKVIDEQLERLRQAKNYGGWNWAAYFLGNNINDTSVGANIFSGILRGEQSGVEQSAVQHWTSSDKNLPAVKKALSVFRHPVFRTLDHRQVFSPTTLVSTPELAIGMSLPQKSLPGLPVFESAEFGRAVISKVPATENQRLFHFGHLVHLDKEYPNEPVDLDLDSLTSHTFITGTTGSGKSTAIYSLLGKLREEKIPFLVIEPAKGEYKDVFGGLRGVQVYGTNPYRNELLRINPFSFPKEIHIIEHIDRLIEILNAAWPMYSAMPAILKQAVEKTYEKYGWNLLTSCNKYSTSVFPDFTDLMEMLPKVIDQTDYSAEVLGNYKGALLERVRSLTNGYYRSIFQKDELAANELFDRSVIVDISRVSSGESKALLMGVLFQKLQEYRMSQETTANSRLKHITVLEEAHHLLRYTSMAQSSEATNLAGKSIEMLTNAIAEMRTYGEGFVIADQAPGLLDSAVIRNTNTKIVFNLPEGDDRELVGKAQGLGEEQINEIAHLRRGQAVVYQNTWLEAVVCVVNKFDAAQMTNMKSAPKFNFAAPTPEELLADTNKQSRVSCKKMIVRLVLEKLQSSSAQTSSEELLVIQQFFPEISELLHDEKVPSQKLRCYALGKILLDECIQKAPTISNMDSWTTWLLRAICSDALASELPEELKNRLVKETFEYLSLIEKDADTRKVWQNASENYQKHLWRIQ